MGIKKQFNKDINKPTKEMYYIIGATMGDGNIQFNKIRFGIKDIEFINKIQKSLEIWTGHKTKRRKITNNGISKKGLLYLIDFCSTEISNLIQQKIKELDKIKDKGLASSYLEGCFDSEGCVSADRLRVRFGVKDKKFFDIVCQKLDLLNIKYTTYLLSQGIYFLSICDKNCLQFHKLIRFSIPKKQKRLEQQIQLYYKKQNYEIKKRLDTLKMTEKIWCKNYPLTRNQYFRHKRKLIN